MVPTEMPALGWAVICIIAYSLQNSLGAHTTVPIVQTCKLRQGTGVHCECQGWDAQPGLSGHRSLDFPVAEKEKAGRCVLVGALSWEPGPPGTSCSWPQFPPS